MTAASEEPLGEPRARRRNQSLGEADHGLIEAARARGRSRWTIIRQALMPEAFDGLVAGSTETLVDASPSQLDVRS